MREAKSAQWQALLHFRDGKPRFKSNVFFLSQETSAFSELEETLQRLKQDPRYVCRFPARWKYLKSRFPNIPENDEHCTELRKYRMSVPFDETSVVYSSENLFYPSSMMGHMMLRVAGIKKGVGFVEHGISFFTELDPWKLPVEIFQSLVGGKLGFFRVSPYQEKVRQYQEREGRNVWEYQLMLSKDQRDLLRDHIWELRNSHLPYFFQSYNCATLTLMLIRVADPTIDEGTAWISPTDVVRLMITSHKINKTSVYLARDWKIRMLEESLPGKAIEEVEKLKDHVYHGIKDQSDTDTAYMKIQLSDAFNDELFITGEITKERYAINKKKITADLDESRFLDLSTYKSPHRLAPDSQIKLSYQSNGKINISFLPASHRLEDDNRVYHGESGLELLSTSISMDREAMRAEVDHLRIYSAQSLLPWSPLTGGKSGQFAIGWEKWVDENLDDRRGGRIDLGIGFTRQLTGDLGVFGLINGGGVAHSKGYDAFISPTAGLYLYEIFSMKTLAMFHMTRFLGEKYTLYESKLTQVYYHTPEISFVLEYKHLQSAIKTSGVFNVGAKLRF